PRQDFLETVVVAALVAQVVRSDLDGLGPLAALAQQDLDAGTVLARLQFGYGPAVGSPGVGEFRPPQPGEEGGGDVSLGVRARSGRRGRGHRLRLRLLEVEGAAGRNRDHLIAGEVQCAGVRRGSDVVRAAGQLYGDRAVQLLCTR